MSNDTLLDLNRAVKDAMESIADARRIAGNMLANDDDGTPIPWAEMIDAELRLQKCEATLSDALSPVRKAINDAQADQDHLEDLHDAQSY
jgi:hypothetical protein